MRVNIGMLMYNEFQYYVDALVAICKDCRDGTRHEDKVIDEIRNLVLDRALEWGLRNSKKPHHAITQPHSAER